MFGLSFLSPWFLAGAAAVAVPIVLHMLRREQAPPLPFTLVRFLRQAPREQTQRRQIKDWWLLCLRMLALILLAVSFARPYIRTGQAAMRGTTVIAVDTSMSMSAPAQFERAKKAALSLASEVPAGDRVAVIAFDDRAAVASMPSIDRGTARAAINGLTAGAGGTSYAAALAAAARVIGPSGGQVIVVSDMQRSGWTGDGALPSDVSLRLVDVSGAVENLAVSALAREGDHLVALVTNHGARARQVRATLQIDGKPAGQGTATVDAGGTVTMRFGGNASAAGAPAAGAPPPAQPVAVSAIGQTSAAAQPSGQPSSPLPQPPGPSSSATGTLTGSLPEKGVAHVTVEDRTGLVADNERYLVLDPAATSSVLVMAEQIDGDDAFYLREAIMAVDPSRAFKVDIVTATQRNELEPARLKTYPVVWLLGTRGLDRRVREALTAYVRDGGALGISAGPYLDASTFATLFDESTPMRVEEAQGVTFPTVLAPVDGRHPIFAAFGPFAANLGQAQFTNALRIVTGDQARTVARFTNGLPALVEQKIGTGRVLVFASDMSTQWNDLPKQPTFVPFVNESLRYLANVRGRARELFVGAVPENASVVGAAGADTPSRTGVLTTTRQPERRVAVNIDPRESWPVKLTEAEFVDHVRRTDPDGRSADIVAREQEAAQAWWRYGLMLLLGVLVVEGLLARRPASFGEPAPAASATR